MGRTKGTMQRAFDNQLYLAEQAAAIRERMEQSKGRLYLEFGGKLLNDFHAARVLPGYDPNVKVRLLKRLQEEAEIILCIHAGAIEQRKVRADYGITYDADAMKLIDDLREWGLSLAAVVITRWNGQSQAEAFRRKIENRGVKVYTHGPIPGYPADPELIVSAAGYGSNPRIGVEKPLVVVTGPGPGSGKMATSLSQIYHDHLLGQEAMYAKFETFPIWNLPLDHPVNKAYEAATLDLQDANLVDPFHLKATGVVAVNYNRDVESFPILRSILERIGGESGGSGCGSRSESRSGSGQVKSATQAVGIEGDAKEGAEEGTLFYAPGDPEQGLYRSPTEMGVNRAGFAIVNDEAAQEAAKQEVVRRYFRCACEHVMGAADRSALEKGEALLKELGIGPEYRRVVSAARREAEEEKKGAKNKRGTASGEKEEEQRSEIYCGAALELPDGTIVGGKNSVLLHAATAAVINGAKALAGLPDSIHLLSPIVIESISRFKQEVLRRQSATLDVDEAMIALSISAALNPMVQACIDQLPELRSCQMHLTHLPTPGDEAGLRKLGINLTSDPLFASRRLFVE